MHRHKISSTVITLYQCKQQVYVLGVTSQTVFDLFTYSYYDVFVAPPDLLEDGMEELLHLTQSHSVVMTPDHPETTGALSVSDQTTHTQATPRSTELVTTTTKCQPMQDIEEEEANPMYTAIKRFKVDPESIQRVSSNKCKHNT